MRTNFDKQLKELNLEIVQMASNVETAISSAVQGLLMRDVNLAEQAIKMDDKTNDYERQIERRCLKLLLHEQPVATDLRKISSCDASLVYAHLRLSRYMEFPISLPPQ